jgi:hypothetical protein
LRCPTPPASWHHQQRQQAARNPRVATASVPPVVSEAPVGNGPGFPARFPTHCRNSNENAPSLHRPRALTPSQNSSVARTPKSCGSPGEPALICGLMNV